MDLDGYCGSSQMRLLYAVVVVVVVAIFALILQIKSLFVYKWFTIIFKSKPLQLFSVWNFFAFLFLLNDNIDVIIKCAEIQWTCTETSINQYKFYWCNF